MTLHAPLDAAQAADKNLLIYNVLPGGWVRGPRITGEIVGPSADWLRVMPDGIAKLDVRASIKADDGSIIYVTYAGRIVLSDAAARRQQSGETLGADDMYFMTSPTFETMSATYGWLNGVVAVGKMVSSKEPRAGEPGHVRYEIFSVA